MLDRMLGADTVALRGFAELQSKSAEDLRQLATSLSLAFKAVHWYGQDVESFRQRWYAAHFPHLRAIADSLDAAANSLKGQAIDQERTSSVKLVPHPVKLVSEVGAKPDLDFDLVVRHPSLLSVLTVLEVKGWWMALAPDQRRRFLISQPLITGNTNGIPFGDRVKANKTNAQNELDRMRQPKGLEEKYGVPALVLTGQDVGPQDAADGDPAKINYLKLVASGQIQLAAYDPTKHALVEMIGHLSPETRHIITYVPGTFTNDGSFFSHQVQGLPSHLVKANKVGDTVAFVYKGGEFPDGSVPDGLLEARGDVFLDQNAPKLGAFQESVDVENKEIGAKTSNISHSWGARLTSGAELAGAHYDQVFALSGAALDPQWRPQAGTEYLSMSYPDPLQTAEQLGVVGINYPMKDPHFEHRWYQPPTGSAWSGPFKAENHNLIVSTSDGNAQVLADLKGKLYIDTLREAA